MENFYERLGSVTGKFYNTQQEWKKAPEWVKTQYKLGDEQHCGDIDSIKKGALQGAVDAVAEHAKQNPIEAALMGKKIAEKAGIEEKYGLAFAFGFLETAHLK